MKQEYDGIVNLELLVLVMSGGRKKLKLVIDTFFVWIYLCLVLFLKLFNMFYMVYAFDVLYFFYIENQGV
jgi:hypothetical protein